MRELHCTVAIMGAGLSGLAAAWELHKKGLSNFYVLEALDRVGGRTLSFNFPGGSYVEQGGTWAGPTQKSLLALASELGITTKSGKPVGSTLYRHLGDWRPVEAGEPDAAQRDFSEALRRFEKLTRAIVVTAPWRTPGAADLDAISVGEWIDQNTSTAGGRTLLEGAVRKMQGGNPHDVSLLWLLHFVASASFHDLLETAEDYRFIGGAQGISLEIARRLGRRVITAAPIERIAWQDHGAVIAETAKLRVIAEKMIVTAMPAALRAIRFEPDLPPRHQMMIDEWTPMSWVKFNALYDRPFWRGKVTGSQFLCLDRRVEAFDISPDNEAFGEIVGFLLPDSAGREAASPAAFAKDFLREVYGDGADRPCHFALQDWNKEPTIGGCVSSLQLGLMTRIGNALTAPVGPLHFAGTERSPVWVNYMEGAVTSGRRAAAAIIAALAGAEASEISQLI